MVLALVLCLGPLMAKAQDQKEIESAYRKYKVVGSSLDINAPTVIEVPFNEASVERYDFAVFDKTTKKFEPYYLKKKILVDSKSLTVSATNTENGAGLMIDGKQGTYTEFSLPESGEGRTEIRLNSNEPITSSALIFLLDNHVSLPINIEIRADNKMVVANKRVVGQMIYFPKTTASNWVVSFTYNQPLRISELELREDGAAQMEMYSVRFLAQPKHVYWVYFDPDRYVNLPIQESGDLQDDKDVVLVSGGTVSNPKYIIADIDQDGIPDKQDNCVLEANPDQADVNRNYKGDVCDDFDKDGLINIKDNCPNQPNRDQLDTDGDGVGDVCDTEESRLTEKYKWVPWLGIVLAVVVLVVLFVITAMSVKGETRKGAEEKDKDGEDNQV